MGYLSTHEELFTFSIDSLPRTKFYVIRFKGREALNETFFFEIQLVCSDSDVDVNQLVGLHADFVFHRETDRDVVHSGCITKISKEERFNGFTYYKAEFRSLLWRAKQFVSTRIYLQHDVSWLVRYLLDGENFYSYPYELRLKEKYPETDFSLQYNQSFFDYLVWRIEQQGIYYYFEPDTEKIIFADNPQAHEAPSKSVHYSSESNLNFLDQENRIKVFASSQSILPNRVIIRNYNWIKPNEIIVGMHTISEKGIGDIYLSNEEVLNQEQADFIAKIRAEQIYSQHRVYYGEGAVSYFRPGFIFTLENHYNQKLNRSYLITKITHEGCQDAFLSLKLKIPLKNTESCLYYKNSFSCIPSDVTYHPPLTAKRPKIHGCLHAFIDGDENNTPFIDSCGRYKVVFPFDHSARTAGKSSCWIRRMQEQVGKDSGLAFPLSTGTEVLIFFINGNPDLPVIKGSVPNGESSSISGGGNRKLSGIRTEGGTQLTFDSKTSGVSLY